MAKSLGARVENQLMPFDSRMRREQRCVSRRRRSLCALCVVAAVLPLMLVIGAGPAAATIIHVKEGSFSGSETPGGAFGHVLVGAAVDQSSGDVWVMELKGGSSRVDKFNENGLYAGVEITGVPAIPGQEAFALGGSSGAAVDNSGGAGEGDVYVADTEHGVVDKFDETGKFVCQITGRAPASFEEEEEEEKFGCQGAKGSPTPDGSIKPAGPAVDASGNLYIADEAHQAIDKFSPAGAYLSQIKDPHLGEDAMRTVALDSEGHLYVWANNEVVKFDTTGKFLAVLAEGQNSQGLAVDSTTNHVYVFESPELGKKISEYDSSGALFSVTSTPEERFLGGLAVNSATGRLYGAELVSGAVAIFSPDITVPTVTTAPATSITEATATLNAHLDPDAAHGGGEITECFFEYGTTSAYGGTAPCTPTAPYVGAEDVSAAIGELTRSTTYHYRVVAANANGHPSLGADRTFTAAGQPVVTGAYAHVIGRDAILRAQVNPLHLDTTCHVQYVDDATFQASKYASATTLPCTPEDLGSGGVDQGASAAIRGLRVGTTYHYRFVAESQAGLVGGADRTFSTFGASEVKFEILNNEGLPFTQAGGHPYELNTSFKVNGFQRGSTEVGVPEGADGNLKDLLTQLPAGLIGDPSATPSKCTRRALILSKCSGAAQVGVIAVDLEGEKGSGERFGIYNLVPPKGVAAEFGASILTEVNIYIDAKLRTGGDYGVTAESVDSTGISAVREVFAKFWGVPGDASHDSERLCPASGGGGQTKGCSAEVLAPKPFLRNPTSCAGPLTTTLSMDSWQNPGEFADTNITMPAITGCSELNFDPSLKIQPTSSVADSPTGLHVDLKVPQGDSPAGLAEADLKEAKVTLPAGFSANPSGADGLAACSAAQIGLTSAAGVTPVSFTPAAASCPDAAKVGTVEVKTPLLDHPLLGAVYIATPYENPFDSLVAIYIAVDDPETGVVVKLAGNVEMNPQTGQLTTTFSGNPQVPFEDFVLDFFGGARAALATPESCGTFATSASLTPWSGTGAVDSSEALAISSGCINGFSPSFTAGTASVQAGGYSPLTLSFSRSDTDQEIAGLRVTLPPGLLAKIAGVQLCPEAAITAAEHNSGTAEAASPSCPAASQVGTVLAGAGAGPHPLFVPGKAYLTGPYKGAPYGLAVVVPAVTGPFDLGTVVVRQSIQVDPHTAQVTAVSDPFPTILKGIPIRLRRVDATIDRPGFAFNPTSCNPTAITAGLSSTGGLNANLSSRFQAGNCSALHFAPKLSASTQARTSKLNGASFDVKVSQRPGEANIGKVDVTLPLVLPARLTTLQKACLAAQFATNPAGCPAGSVVGHGTARTPVLASPLSGSAYLVSHGGAAFPDLVVVLHGEGVTIELTGNTDIKHGITYSHFDTVPDAPISSFELTLPQGPDSVLAAFLPPKAKGSLCSTSLVMPTRITAQDGAQLSQNTKITVAGCAKHKQKRHKKAVRRRKK